MLHPQGRAFKGGGGNPTAFPQKKRCNLKKELLPSSQVLFGCVLPLQGRRIAKGCHRRSRLQTAAAGFVGIFCGGVLIFRSRRLRFFFTCLFEKRIPRPVSLSEP